MPTYEYECLKCGKKFELFQGMTEAPRKRCPTCRGKVRRLVGTGAGMIFKGTGFYVTDYRSTAYRDEKKKDSGEKPPAKDEPKAKSEPKTGTKPGAKSGESPSKASSN